MATLLLRQKDRKSNPWPATAVTSWRRLPVHRLHACADSRLDLHVSLPLNACGLHAIPPAPCRRNSLYPRSCRRIPHADREATHTEMDMDVEQAFQLVDQIRQAVLVEPEHDTVDVYIRRAKHPLRRCAAKKPVDLVLSGNCCAQNRLLTQQEIHDAARQVLNEGFGCFAH